MRFLAGAFSVVLVWVAYEVFRNPHGHRGGREEFKPVLAQPYQSRLAKDLIWPLGRTESG